MDKNEVFKSRNLEKFKRYCKYLRKFTDISLMQIQHKVSVEFGYRCYKDLMEDWKNGK